MFRIGRWEISAPAVLAPMAGITNLSYRQLCLEQGAGLYVCEMITSRGIVERAYTLDEPWTAELALADVEACEACLVAIGDDGALRAAMPGMSGKAQVKDLVELRFD